jgi:class 3 adenylate cyclase
MASHLDPVESWREIVAGYQRAAAKAIERFDGQVAQYLGDGVMAFLGYPEAHDNDAERAARAGPRNPRCHIEPQRVPQRTQSSRRESASIQARRWLAPTPAKDINVFGDTPNIAARAQAAAAPGTALMTAVGVHHDYNVAEPRALPSRRGSYPAFFAVRSL